MGWWTIDPATGQPAEDGAPMVEGDVEYDEYAENNDCLMGDPPWDYCEDAVDQILEVAPEARPLADEQLQRLFSYSLAKRRRGKIDSEAFEEINDILDEMWQEIDEAYSEAVDRLTKPAERKWIIAHMIEHCRLER